MPILRQPQILFVAMRKAAAEGDAPALQRAPRICLSSGSTNVGALAFAAQCKELESIGQVGGARWRRAAYIAAAADAFDDVAVALKAQVE